MIPSLILGLTSSLSVGLAIFIFDFNSVFKKLTSKIFSGVSLLFDNQLSDFEKETELRRVAPSVLILSVKLLGMIMGVAVMFCVGPLMIYLLKIENLSNSFRYLISFEYLLFIVTISILFIQLASKRNKKNKISKETYSIIDQFIHNLIMMSLSLKFLAKIDTIFDRKYRVDNKNPIFILGIPRSGSTALLNALYSIPNFGTYTYRYLPFLTLPCITKFSFSFRKNKIKTVERAHGDGHKIDLDSPEAFDEILWKLYYPEIYKKSNIQSLKSDSINDKFKFFFRRQIIKISNIESERKGVKIDNFQKTRYVSKNNANISRISALLAIFPDANFLVPFRDPLSQSKSLLRQHLLFSKIHETDPFVLKYMNDLGHFEFGVNHKTLVLGEPFNYLGTPNDLEYWLAYWNYAYGFLLKQEVSIGFISLNRLINFEKETMNKVLDFIGCDFPWKSSFKYFKDSNYKLDNANTINRDLLREAYAIYDKLIAMSV